MARRDRADRRRGRGARAERRSRAPRFLQDDDEDEVDVDPSGGLLAGMKKRTRKQYDERRDIDDAEGADDVGLLCNVPSYVLTCSLQDVPLEHLGDIKADSISAWIATESVQRTIEKHFLNFIMTYVDEHGTSVYGQRIRNLGERTCSLLYISSFF